MHSYCVSGMTLSSVTRGVVESLLPDRHIDHSIDAVARAVSRGDADAMRAGEEPPIPDAEIDVRAKIGPGHEIALLCAIGDEGNVRDAVWPAVIRYRCA